MLKNDAQLKQKSDKQPKKIQSPKFIKKNHVQKKKEKKKKKMEEATSSGKQKANIYNWKKFKKEQVQAHEQLAPRHFCH